HPDNVFLAERIARLVNLDICGIDMIAKDVSSPITAGNGAVIEVNAGPGLRMHLSPSRGNGRNVAEPLMRMLFPPGAPSRIPLVAVTGTNGKTTTTRLMAHIAKTAGHSVGFTSTDGIYINGREIYHGDCSGPASAAVVLRDPIVDFAVLECARGGILRSGLAFDKCDVSVITNIAADHLGLGDIDTLDELARVKSVVARSTGRDGYAVLNADDDLVYAMKNEVDCNVALFSMDENSERVSNHCDQGCIAAIVERGYFTLCKGEWRIRVARVNDVPLTLDGRASCMIQNTLAAILAAAVRDVDVRVLRKALMSFIPGPEMTPGRMNIFRFDGLEVMVDYAHNAHGMQQLAEFIKRVPSATKVGIITSPGDRRDEDIEGFGAEAAKIFDRLVIRHDKDTRGRSAEEITTLLKKGIHSVNHSIEPEIVSDEITAIRHAMATAREGTFIVVCSDAVRQAIDFLENEAQRTANGKTLHQRVNSDSD
ncbi:MAG TPA: Mur ligase family protein, partial [Chitinophagaceae bacterium]